MDKTSKTCHVCKEEKLITEFHRNRTARDGLAKRCKPCSKVIMAAQYAKDPSKWRARERLYAAENPEKVKEARRRKTEYMQQYAAENPETMAVIWHRKKCKKYGLTTEQFDAMVLSQGGLCAICGEAGNIRNGQTIRLHIDHCHTTGKVRALLCFQCNSMLGMSRDSTKNLNSAIEYLKRYQT